MKYVFPTVVVIFIWVLSCAPEKKKITTENFSNLTEKIKAENTVHDTIYLHLLDYLNKPEHTEELAKVAALELTPNQLFAHLDSVRKIEANYTPHLQSLFYEIDEFCIDHQHQVEEFLLLKNRLKNMVDVRIVALRKTTWDYYKDVIELKVRAYNRSGKPIRRFDYSLRFAHKNGDASVILDLDFPLPVENTYNYSYIYDDVAHRNTYNALEDFMRTGYEYTYQITGIAFPGETISLKNKEIAQLFSRSKYIDNAPRVESASDYCPYLNETDPLIMEVTRLLNEKNQEIKGRYPYLYDFWKQQSSKLHEKP